MSPNNQNWASFYSYAGLELLSKTDGVFYIDETAWIFDTSKTLPVFSLVVLQASQHGLPLFVFDLSDDKLSSRILSYPQSEKLKAFLSA